MAKIKTEKLVGAALNWAAATAEGRKNLEIWHTGAITEKWPNGLTVHHAYADKWEQAGAIIDRAGISIVRCDDDYGTDAQGFTTSERIPVWFATMGQHSIFTLTEHQSHEPMYQVGVEWGFYGPTSLIAAMRCFVAEKLGAEVDMPDELLKGA